MWVRRVQVLEPSFAAFLGTLSGSCFWNSVARMGTSSAAWAVMSRAAGERCYIKMLAPFQLCIRQILIDFPFFVICWCLLSVFIWKRCYHVTMPTSMSPCSGVLYPCIILCVQNTNTSAWFIGWPWVLQCWLNLHISLFPGRHLVHVCVAAWIHSMSMLSAGTSVSWASGMVGLHVQGFPGACGCGVLGCAVAFSFSELCESSACPVG